MKKIIVLFFLCLLLFMLDNALMPFVAIKGYYPSLLLVFCICYSIVNGSWEGLGLAIFTGALQDLYLFNGFGINMLANMIVFVCAAKVGETIFRQKYLIPIFATLILSALKGAIVFVILYAFKQNSDPMAIVYNSLYTMVIAIFIYGKVYKFCQKPYMLRKWSFKE